MIDPSDATGGEGSAQKIFWRAFRDDDKGVISVMAAFTRVIVIGSAALVADAGSLLLA